MALDPCELLYGPYTPPLLKLGDRTVCRLRESCHPGPLPQDGGARALRLVEAPGVSLKALGLESTAQRQRNGRPKKRK
jgi:hypothetical protein